MKAKTLLTISLLLVFAMSFTACAKSRDLGQSFRATTAGFSFDRGRRQVNVPLEVKVSHWAVNCNRTRAVVWGQAKDLEEVGSPPVARVYLIDLENEKIIGHFTVTRGPYEVVFSRDQKHASVDDYVIDQMSGELVGMTEDIKLAAESCASFPGQRAN